MAELIAVVAIGDIPEWRAAHPEYVVVGGGWPPGGKPTLELADVAPAAGGGYPGDWDAIARRVKEEAGWKCEHCGHQDDRASGHVLTVHHLDGDKGNCAEANLVALCQKCHLSLQARLQPGQLVTGFAREAWMVRRGIGGPG